MSLSKQLMTLISAMFLGIYAVNIVLSISTIRDYLEVESETHAQDTATSLGLSLSPYILDKDDTILETMVNTIFDRGYFLEIVLTDMDDEVLVRKTNPKTFAEVPDWFVKLLPMRTVSVESEIDAGWVIGGRVQVTIHPGFGYLKLWEQTKETSQISLMLLIGVMLLLLFVIKTLLKPLQRIKKQAIQISEGKYSTIDLPWTTEMRSVAIAMNLMSGKIERVIGNLNERLQDASKRLHTDALTGLETRLTFETTMKERFMSNKQGHLFVIRINRLADYAQSHSPEKVDSLIRDFTQTVLKITSENNSTNDRLFRIVGAEFVLVCESLDRKGAEEFCNTLSKSLDELSNKYDKPDMAHIGGVTFDALSTTATLISAATEAYEKARLIGDNSFAFSEGSENARTIDEWRKLVDSAITDNLFDITYAFQAYSLLEGEESQIVIEEAVSQVKDRDDPDQLVPIGTFISIAETSGRINEFDFKVITNVLNHIKQASIKHQIAVNVSMSSLRDNNFRRSLFNLLEQRAEEAQHLTFSITAYAATQDIDSFVSFISFAHRAGARVMLKRFESRLIEVAKLGSYQVDYIRLARHYTEDLSKGNEKILVVESMRDVGELLNVAIIAESVKAEEDLLRLKQIGIQAASR